MKDEFTIAPIHPHDISWMALTKQNRSRSNSQVMAFTFQRNLSTSSGPTESNRFQISLFLGQLCGTYAWHPVGNRYRWFYLPQKIPLFGPADRPMGFPWVLRKSKQTAVLSHIGFKQVSAGCHIFVWTYASLPPGSYFKGELWTGCYPLEAWEVGWTKCPA